MTASFTHSYIYAGKVVHKRFLPKNHHFSSSLYMLALDVDDLAVKSFRQGLFGLQWYHPLRFVPDDYVVGGTGNLLERIKLKVNKLGGHGSIARILMLAQVRCFGLYFSPVNFYFCYDEDDNCTQMLAEVSNTPWNERHYYLVNLLENDCAKTTKKAFQVSPFMDLAMYYTWSVIPPHKKSKNLLVRIENRRFDPIEKGKKLFEANLLLKQHEFNQRNLLRIWFQLPVMTLKIVTSIYWQALRLYIKKVPFIGYQKSGE